MKSLKALVALIIILMGSLSFAQDGESSIRAEFIELKARSNAESLRQEGLSLAAAAQRQAEEYYGLKNMSFEIGTDKWHNKMDVLLYNSTHVCNYYYLQGIYNSGYSIQCFERD